MRDDSSRFWEKVQVGGEDDCWPWTRSTNVAGYGRIAWNGRMQNVHAVAWQLSNGEIEVGDVVLQTCGTKRCCNPLHLIHAKASSAKDARFWLSVDRRADDECWEWKKGCRSDGVAIYYVDRLPVMAHKTAWELTNGRISEDDVLVRLCTSKTCCNPKHMMVLSNDEALAHRFWLKVAIGEPDDCWNWKGSLNEHGYGSFNGGDRTRKSHRVAWELTNGEIPKGDGYHGTCVCHKCDNPQCCNPAHLFLGTTQENMDDKVAKGRSYKPRPGDNVFKSVLSPDDVRRIRKIKDQTYSQIASAYGVSKGAIQHVKSGLTWAFISDGEEI